MAAFPSAPHTIVGDENNKQLQLLSTGGGGGSEGDTGIRPSIPALSVASVWHLSARARCQDGSGNEGLSAWRALEALSVWHVL